MINYLLLKYLFFYFVSSSETKKQCVFENATFFDYVEMYSMLMDIKNIHYPKFIYIKQKYFICYRLTLIDQSKIPLHKIISFNM